MSAIARIEAALADAVASGPPGVAVAARLLDGQVFEAAAGDPAVLVAFAAFERAVYGA